MRTTNLAEDAFVGCGRDPRAGDGGLREESGAEGESAGSGGVESTPELEAAVDDYEGYVVDEADQLVAETGTFTDAVISGDLDAAKATYAPVVAVI